MQIRFWESKFIYTYVYVSLCISLSLQHSHPFIAFATFYSFAGRTSPPQLPPFSLLPRCALPPSLLFLHSSFDSFASPEEQKSFFLFFRPSGCLAARSQPPFLTRNRVLTELRPCSDLGRARSKSDNLKSPFTIPATLAITLATFAATAATPTRPLDLSRRFK